MTQNTTKFGLTALMLASLSTLASAQTPAGMAAAVQKALSTNPEVTARLNALQAAANETDVARGGFLPRVDLNASVGRDRDRITSRDPENRSLSRNGVALSATQMLWDGQATRKEVERLGHARTVRYFEFLSASEDTALEAARAYLDVLRYRKMVQLAEDNYVQHKYAADQLQSKFKAGVGRGVDAEQSNARLALAESNLTTEIANLHDVSARFLRIVGEAPTPSLPQPAGLDKGLLAANAEHVNQALARNPAISAAVENLRAVEAQAEGRESAFQPRVEARVRTGMGNNFDGVQNQKRDTAAELVLNWNLYNGGSDRARVRQFADLINQAADQRDKACRDVRQTSAIAHNDIRKLRDQLAALDRNVLAIEKARDAYRQQFDIGQRSLLDLLNSENELYTARRAYANAEHDLLLAYARSQAARHTLISTLGLTQDGNQSDLVKDWQAADDAAQRCPVVSVEVSPTSREELDARARKLAVPAAAVAPVAAPAVQSSAVQAKAPASAEAVTQRLRDWAAAWMSKDADRYLSFYARGFKPSKGSVAQWTADRRRLVTKPGAIDVQLDQIKATAQGDTVVTTFEQGYSSSNFKDRTAKALTWQQQDGQWVIVRESNR
ncbi:TolC family outer membrane protein [uncultured Aquabacterium sp.]|uniref:TolC family outer membrane protein n=1 Tax=Aquabacterium sp. TaxID=1872578 RepID=UPI0025D82904|nr:TolC family outer membrane protein [uncultured Aquabacterium sp.]